MKTSEKAPRTSGSTAGAAASTPGCEPAESGELAPLADRPVAANSPGWEGSPPFAASLLAAKRAVSTSVSEVARLAMPADCWLSRPASSSVLIRLPLWPSARLADGVALKVGCAFSQTEDPLVE